MRYGLTDREWCDIDQILLANPRVEGVILFGSRAKGNHKPGSDVDLALVGALKLNDLLDLHEQLDDLNLPYRFDLVALREVDDADVLAHIRRVGVALAAREGVV